MASPEGSNKPFFLWNSDDKSFRIHGNSLMIVVLVFFVMVCLIFFYVYAKWVLRKPLPVTVPDGGAAVASANRHGLNRMIIEGLQVQVLRQAAEEVRCSICLENLVEGNKVKVLPGCGHGFHAECLDAWLKTQVCCPLCRASLGPSSTGSVEAV